MSYLHFFWQGSKFTDVAIFELILRPKHVRHSSAHHSSNVNNLTTAVSPGKIELVPLPN